MHYVYILKCADNSFYTGITWNLKKRINEHRLGINCSFTKIRRPIKLAYWEKYDNKFLAAKKEKEIKGWSRKKKEILIRKFTPEAIA